jgi:hypothetical protein
MTVYGANAILTSAIQRVMFVDVGLSFTSRPYIPIFPPLAYSDLNVPERHVEKLGDHLPCTIVLARLRCHARFSADEL